MQMPVKQKLNEARWLLQRLVNKDTLENRVVCYSLILLLCMQNISVSSSFCKHPNFLYMFSPNSKCLFKISYRQLDDNCVCNTSAYLASSTQSSAIFVSVIRANESQQYQWSMVFTLLATCTEGSRRSLHNWALLSPLCVFYMGIRSPQTQREKITIIRNGLVSQLS